MKVLILGAGRVGGSLARALVNNGYDVAIIDQDKNALNSLEEKLDILTIEGHASHPVSIKKSSADESTTVIAVTADDEVNIIACQIAKKSFNVKKTICRITDSAYGNDLTVFGDNAIDILISPENEVKNHLKDLILHPGLKGIKDDMPETDAFIASIYRKGKPFIPSGETIIKENDEVYFISSEKNTDQIVDEFRDHEETYSRVMIVGGGKIGMSLAKEIEGEYKTKIIDSDEEKCASLSKQLDKAIVLHGSATDEDLLKSESVSNIDIFCALTDDDETNLMSSLLAKKMGAKKTMIILNNPSYLGLVPGFIDIYVAPYRLTVSSVLQDLRDSDVTQDVMLKMDTGAEAVEGIVHANEYTSSLFGKSIKEISLPEGASIGAVIRHGELIMPRSEVELCLNDHLIIFLANKNMMSEVEVLFKTN